MGPWDPNLMLCGRYGGFLCDELMDYGKRVVEGGIWGGGIVGGKKFGFGRWGRFPVCCDKLRLILCGLEGLVRGGKRWW